MNLPGNGDQQHEHQALPAGWLMTDAWVFAAIANDRSARAHSLGEIIAIADGINHAVLAESEFTSAVGRLLSVGLIEADAAADQYRTTESGSAIRRRWRHGAFGWIDAIPPQLERLGAPQDTGWSLPTGTFDAAVRQYLSKWPADTPHPPVGLTPPPRRG